ncbi:MAG TPA: helix-turn-helix transcriptional regulator [Longimicrobiales bacterium]|nr:helix-turn-helix transcriptional regulator [Longimicrobiales bacterium]
MTPIRLTQATALVLRAMTAGHRYGFEIMEASGLPSGTVYPVLRRLEEWGHVTSHWEEEAEARTQGRPRRRLYALTRAGMALAGTARERLAEARRLLAEDPGMDEVRGAGEA